MTDLSPRTTGTIFHQGVINVHVVIWAHTSATMIFLPEDAGCSSEIHVPTDPFLNSEHQQWPVPIPTNTLPYKKQVMDRKETLLHYSYNISLTSLKPPYIYTLRCSPNIMKPHRASNITHHMSWYKIYQAPSNNTKTSNSPQNQCIWDPQTSKQKIPGQPTVDPHLVVPKETLALASAWKQKFPKLGRLSWESLVKMGRDLKFRDLSDFDPEFYEFLSHKYLDQTFDFQKSSESLRENEGKPPWFMTGLTPSRVSCFHPAGGWEVTPLREKKDMNENLVFPMDKHEGIIRCYWSS